jgi:hypothetical protein
MKKRWKRRGRVALHVLAVTYFASIALDSAGCSLPSHVLPRPALYFTQVAALFPKVAYFTIDYRAEQWVCSRNTWEELDTRPYFPINPDDKESGFNRSMHFFRENRKTMHALEHYLERGHDEIGGVRFLSLRMPIPKVGSSFDRYERLPLSDYPKAERQYFYHTPESARAKRCGHD